MSENFLRSVRHCGVNSVAFVLFNLTVGWQVVCSAPPRKENSGVVLGSLGTESRNEPSKISLYFRHLASLISLIMEVPTTPPLDFDHYGTTQAMKSLRSIRRRYEARGQKYGQYRGLPCTEVAAISLATGRDERQASGRHIDLA